MNDHIGEFVYAIAGRDKRKAFICIKSEDEFLFICNGKSRKSDKPKKKKIKHLTLTGKCDEFLKSKLIKNLPVTNREIKKALSVFLDNNSSV